MKQYKIINEPDFIYHTGQIISDEQLIKDYINAAYEIEDADVIGWMNTSLQTGNTHKQIEFISEVWELILLQLV